MALLNSKSRSGLDNLTVEASTISEIKLSPPFPKNPHLWILYFYGKDEKLVRTWYYDCPNKRQKDLNQVLERCSHLKVA